MSFVKSIRAYFTDAILNFSSRSRYYVLHRKAPVPEGGDPDNWRNPRKWIAFDDVELVSPQADGMTIHLRYRGTRASLQALIRVNQADALWDLQPMPRRAMRTVKQLALPNPNN